MTDGSDDLVEVYRASGLPEAHAVRLSLESEGITARIENELLQGALGELPLGWATAPRILVAKADEQAARAILQRRRPAASATSGGDGRDLRCLACSAQMGEADTCPSCGWTYAAPPTEPAVSDESAVVSAPEAAIEVPPPLPRADHRALWWEVAVVLAVGVIPNLMGAISFVFQPTPPLPYWLDTLHFAILSGCTILVVMYLIGRSGDGWERFGVVRPRWWDAAIALVLMLVCESIWRIIEGFPWPELATSHVAFPQAQGLADHIMMVAKHGLSAFAEEIVRVYLITRLAVLFRSRCEAVLVSAILFASYHLYQGLPGLANALLIGIAFGIVFLLLRRVWPLALGHALYNIWLELLAS